MTAPKLRFGEEERNLEERATTRKIRMEIYQETQKIDGEKNKRRGLQ